MTGTVTLALTGDLASLGEKCIGMTMVTGLCRHPRFTIEVSRKPLRINLRN